MHPSSEVPLLKHVRFPCNEWTHSNLSYLSFDFSFSIIKNIEQPNVYLLDPPLVRKEENHFLQSCQDHIFQVWTLLYPPPCNDTLFSKYLLFWTCPTYVQNVLFVKLVLDKNRELSALERLSTEPRMGKHLRKLHVDCLVLYRSDTGKMGRLVGTTDYFIKIRQWAPLACIEISFCGNV